MAKTILKKRIRQGLFLLDGAMGTQLIARGIDAGGCSDYLNIASPDTVFEIHKSYADAGSNAILTNTFGANSIALARHGHSEKVEKINVTGADCPPSSRYGKVCIGGYWAERRNSWNRWES